VPCDAGDDDLFLIAYTSGTTGRPKGAMVTNLGAVHACLNWAKGLGTSGAETAILAIPASHIGGTAGVILPMLYCTGKIVLMREFRTEPFLKLAEKERMTYGVFVPAIYNLCLLNPTFADFDLSAWRWGIFSGAPMPEATIRKMHAALPGLTLVSAYGATEATSAIAIMPPKDGASRPDSVGLTVACGHTMVMGDDNVEVAPGEVGELWVAGPMVVAGYWADADATASAFVGGYWKSGDIGSIDADGYVRVLDRRKEMISRGGMKVFAAEVENMLNEHPLVIEAAVFGHPDPVLGERVHAVVVSNATLDADEIREFCRNRLADYKTPEIIAIRAEPLPRNSNGKIMKRVLANEGDAACPA
jgi:acyl-CoA synthetase (AMP-forming)/AMP-acid ligase II